MLSMGVLIIGGGKTQLNRVIGNFDVSGLPASAFVLAAKMRRSLTLVDPTGHGCKIVRCTRPGQWTENGVTWNKYDGVTSWTAIGGDFDTSAPVPVAYQEPLVTGTHEIPGLAGFIFLLEPERLREAHALAAMDCTVWHQRDEVVLHSLRIVLAAER